MEVVDVLPNIANVCAKMLEGKIKPEAREEIKVSGDKNPRFPGLKEKPFLAMR